MGRMGVETVGKAVFAGAVILCLLAVMAPGGDTYAAAKKFARKDCLDCHKKFADKYLSMKAVHPGVKTPFPTATAKDFKAALERASAANFVVLEVTTTPSGATVLVDGRRIDGVTPLTIPQLEPGVEHSVLVRHPARPSLSLGEDKGPAT